MDPFAPVGLGLILFVAILKMPQRPSGMDVAPLHTDPVWPPSLLASSYPCLHAQAASEMKSSMSWPTQPLFISAAIVGSILIAWSAWISQHSETIGLFTTVGEFTHSAAFRELS